MLPSQLLRVRTKKGEIFPLLIGGENKSGHLQLAKIIINEFEELAAKKEKKKILYERISLVERNFDDYRLVRGLSTLLERRCQFSKNIHQQDNNRENLSGPAEIRRLLWEESSRRGFALTESRRNEILTAITSSTRISQTSIMQSIWSDLDENMTLESFDSIDAEELLRWYNLSLLQTLLFTCTRLEFSVSGGTYWKKILRKVKRLGLMYNLKEHGGASENPHAENDNVERSKKHPIHANIKNTNGHDKELVCTIEGPVSLFKLTDRYGTSIAKLIPFITSSSRWHLRAFIVRKTMSGKKIFEFKASYADFEHLKLCEPYHSYRNSSVSGRLTSSDFDSSLEEKFAIKFEHLANRWRIQREPDPLVVGNGVAFIPDFLFEKYDRKVYLEIVGFWTKDYLEKKFQKISEILHNNNIDLFVAVDEELSCSKLFNPSFHDRSYDRIIFFRNASIPVKKIKAYLMSIDKLQIESRLLDPDLRIILDGTKDVISIEEISETHKVPLEIAAALATRDNNNSYLKIDSWFVSKSKLNVIAKLLIGAAKFTEACDILSENSIPEVCHSELISILGYDVVWRSMDADGAVIVKRI
jgi:predicted nuclease of restriction endonuclease-like RecB superfamily